MSRDSWFFTVPLCVKSKFEKSYKDIPDEKFEEVVEYIEELKRNPSQPTNNRRTFRLPLGNVSGMFPVNRILQDKFSYFSLDCEKWFGHSWVTRRDELINTYPVNTLIPSL